MFKVRYTVIHEDVDKGDNGRSIITVGKRFTSIEEAKLYIDMIVVEHDGHSYHHHIILDYSPTIASLLEEYHAECEADSAINLAKDKQALQDDDYLPF